MHKIVLGLLYIFILISPAFGIDHSAKRVIKIIGVGDISLAGSALELKNTKGFGFAFGNTRDIIRSADVAICNLESPVTERGTPHPTKTYVFRQPPSALEAIADAGFDIFSLANNHIMDYGKQGLVDTINVLKDKGLSYAGAGINLYNARTPAIVNINGVRLGYLAYSLTFPKDFWAKDDKPGTVFGHERYVRHDVAQLADIVDIVAVGFHWGAERRQYTKPYQVMLAHSAIEAGANIIFGHHPHVLEGIEWYKQGIIFYSLGNFVFGSYSENSRTGAIAIVNIMAYGNIIKEVEIVPLNVYNPRVLFNTTPIKTSLDVISELEEISSSFNSRFKTKGDFIQVLPPE